MAAAQPRLLRRVFAIAALLALPAAAPADPGIPGEIVIGPRDSLARAARTAPEGVVITLLPGDYRQCAVLGKSLTLRAQTPGTVTFRDVACEAKAALVLRGKPESRFVIDGLRFRDIRVRDLNGAGIRVERGSALIRRADFAGTEMGVLTSAGKEIWRNIAELVIEDSRFSDIHLCPPKCGTVHLSHAIYANGIGRLIVRRSRFERVKAGHYIKSRARQTEVVESVIDDRLGTASYLVDIPNGGGARIEGNTLIKGPGASNRCCIIRVGAEGVTNPPAPLLVRGNRVENATGGPTILLFNQTRTVARLEANRTEGFILSSVGPAD